MCTEADKARGQKPEYFFADIDYSARKDSVSRTYNKCSKQHQTAAPIFFLQSVRKQEIMLPFALFATDRTISSQKPELSSRLALQLNAVSLTLSVQNESMPM